MPRRRRHGCGVSFHLLRGSAVFHPPWSSSARLVLRNQYAGMRSPRFTYSGAPRVPLTFCVKPADSHEPLCNKASAAGDSCRFQQFSIQGLAGAGRNYAALPQTYASLARQDGFAACRSCFVLCGDSWQRCERSRRYQLEITLQSNIAAPLQAT